MLLLLLRCLQLRSMLLQPLHADRSQTRSSHAGIDHGHQLRRHTALEGFTQHRLFDASLLQAKRLLPGLLFLLLALVFLGLRNEPLTHGFLLTVPLVGRLWDHTQRRRQRRLRRSRRRWRRRMLPGGIRQGHCRRRRQAAVGSGHGQVRGAGRQRYRPRRVDSGLQRRGV